MALAAFVLGGLFCGYLFYASVRDIAAYANLPFLPGQPLHSAQVAGLEREDPVGKAAVDQPAAQDTEGYINILLLGIDAREGKSTPCRTDTMILLSVDRKQNTVTMLSIPRDLWVPMPPGLDLGVNRINAAHLFGDLYKYPGGGPALAKRTVQYNLGVPVHYYVRIDFQGFQRAIDEIGGIEVDVPRELVDTKYPTADGGVMTLHIQAGRQHMNGDQALKYVRTRHDNSDIDRARRQQQVILAVRDKALKLNIPLARLPGLIRILGDSFKTDLPLAEIVALAQVTRQMQATAIRQGVIDETMTVPWRTPEGWDVLVPQRDKVRALVAELFPLSALAVVPPADATE